MYLKPVKAVDSPLKGDAMRLAAGWRCTFGAGLLFEVGYLEAGRGHRLLGHDLRTHAAERFGWTNGTDAPVGQSMHGKGVKSGLLL